MYANQPTNTTLFGGGDGEEATEDVDYSFAPELPAKTAESTDNNNRSDVINAMELLEQQTGQSGDPDNVYDVEMPVVDDDAQDEIEPSSQLTNDSGVETLVMQDNDVYEDSCVTDMGAPYYGGFWYKDCSKIRPTNSYCGVASCSTSSFAHMTWTAWRGNTYSLKTMKMMMRPVTY